MISSLLFLTVVEVLDLKLRQNQNIHRIDPDIPNLRAQYADDTWAMLKYCAESLRELMLEFRNFADFSGLNINFDKTKIKKIGPVRFTPDMINTDEHLVWAGSVKILGIIVSPDIKYMQQVNYESLLQKLKNLIFCWSAISPL